MVEVTRSRVIPARAEALWGLVADATRLGEWFAIVDRGEVLEGEGPGRRQRVHGRWRGRVFEVDQRVTRFEPPHLLEWRHEAERLEGKPAPRFAAETTVSVRLEPEGGATRVTLASRQRPAGALKGLALRLGARRLGRDLERSLDRLAGA